MKTVSTYYLLRRFFLHTTSFAESTHPKFDSFGVIISTQLDNCVIMIRLKFQLMVCSGFKTLCKMSPLNSRWFQIRCSRDDDAHWTASYFIRDLLKQQQQQQQQQQQAAAAAAATAAARHTVMGQ